MKKIYFYPIFNYLFSLFSAMVFLFASNQLISQPVLSLTSVISGLNQPMQFVNAGDGTNRIFIVQKGGTILVYNSSFVLQGTFLTVSNVSTTGERGLLSMAFHPDYETNGFFYVYYTNNTPGSVGDLEIARYHVSGDPNIGDATSKVILKTIPHQLAANHNGGQLHFGIDGYMYLSTGDGGSGGDPLDNAQNKGVLLGKMLRFNVNTSDIAPYYTIPPDNPFGNEIFALGLRNPYRWSFDRQTHDMWIGDVGQDSYEEINFVPAASSLGINYGWRCYEGNVMYNTTGCLPMSNYTFPAFAYVSQNPSASVTGGVVYRGNTYPFMKGWYFAADFFSGIFYKVKSNGMGGFNTFTQTLAPTGIVNFGETEAGEVFVVSNTNNTVWRLEANSFLPLNLISFSAEKRTNGVQLNWTTEEEENVEGFEIEYSYDGSKFSYLNNVPVVQNQSNGNYGYFHEIKLNGDLFYRLKIVEKESNNYTYSNIVRLKMDNGAGVFISPTLIEKGEVSIRFATGAVYSDLEIVDVSGRTVILKDITGKSDLITIPLNKLNSGIYFVRVSGRQGVVLEKIIIQ